MDSYFRKSQTLKTGEKDTSITKSQSRSVSVDQTHTKSIDPRDEARASREIKKVVYQSDICEIKNQIDELKSSINAQQIVMALKVDEINNQLINTKQDQEQAKNERIKQKLDAFIVQYNENEKNHSDTLISIQKSVTELNDRVKVVEEVL